jgi:type 1 fimbriae regulatory protein FimB/type 1 fimbriae regulatory protein FimE
MILVAYRHGLRASEVCDLQWHQIELAEGRLHVRRVKNGTPSVHPIRGDEMRALRKLRRERPSDAYVFVSERGGPMNPIGFHRTATLPRSQEHPAHRALYRIGRGSVQGLLVLIMSVDRT